MINLNQEVYEKKDKRLIEVLFYSYLKRLMKQYNHSTVVYDLISCFAELAEVPAIVIKKLLQQIVIGGTWLPNREEVVFVLRRSGLSYRKIQKITGIAPSTQYIINIRLENINNQPSLAPQMDEGDFDCVVAFMREVQKFVEVDF